MLTIVISAKRDMVFVCKGVLPEGVVKERHEIISGEMAEDLYLALTGHAYGEEPGLASYCLAYEARQMIRCNGRKLFGEARRQARLAGEVIDRWGEKIVPWLHVTKLKDRRIVVDAPEYYQEIRPGQEAAAA